jgi:signal transduction histidine kinase
MVSLAIVALVTRIDVQSGDAYRFHADTWWSWVATIAICVTLLGRRRWPLTSFVIGIGFALPLELGHHRDSIAFFSIVVAFFSVAAYSPLRLACRAIALMVAFYTTLLATQTMMVSTAPLVGLCFLTVAFSFGLLIRRNRVQQEHEVEAAAARGMEAIEIAELQAADERLRMAQELHDVVAHSLSVIAVQAGIGVHLIERQPTEAGRALDAIRTVSRTTATELTRLLDLLREGNAREDALSVQTIDNIAGLIEQTRATGLPIVYSINTSLQEVPAGVALAAYRIVQEGLTNVVRHAGRAEVTVSVQLRDDGLTLCIEDNGHGVTASIGSEHGQGANGGQGGHGLIGMVERAQLYGGSVRTGPRPGGGFRVNVAIPYLALPITNVTNPADVPSIANVPSVTNATSKTNVTNTANSASDPKLGDNRLAGKTVKRMTSLPTWLGNGWPGNGWLGNNWFGDGLLAAVFSGLIAAQILLTKPHALRPPFTSTDAREWSLKVACSLLLVVRRRSPTSMYTALWVLGLALAIGDYQVGVITFILLIGMYSVATYASTPKAVGALFGTVVGMALIAWSKPPDLTPSGAVWISFLFAAVAVSGYAIKRDRELRFTALSERENATEAQTRRARLVIATERLRIADELNTVITKSIQTITIEAGAGSQMIETDPIAARRALEAISALSREALNDLRRLLKRIRTESEPTVYLPITQTTLATPTGFPK